MKHKFKNKSCHTNWMVCCLTEWPKTWVYQLKSNIFLGGKITCALAGFGIIIIKVDKVKFTWAGNSGCVVMIVLILNIISFEPKAIFRNNDHIS